MSKRVLTADEKHEAREKRRREELVTHPGTTVQVSVEDETDDDGEPIVRAVVQIVMPKDWKSRTPKAQR